MKPSKKRGKSIDDGSRPDKEGRLARRARSGDACRQGEQCGGDGAGTGLESLEELKEEPIDVEVRYVPQIGHNDCGCEERQREWGRRIIK